MALLAKCRLRGTSTLSMSRYYEVEKKSKETPAAYDERTWRERLHYHEDSGLVFVNPMAWKWCITDSASLLGKRVPGRGTATYAKFFMSGILVTDGMELNVHKDSIPHERLFVPANGKHGSGTRVWRNFPAIYPWSGAVTFQIINRTITRDVFEEHLGEAGQYIGIGRFRPQVGGFYGRFMVEGIEYEDTAPPVEEEEAPKKKKAA